MVDAFKLIASPGNLKEDIAVSADTLTTATMELRVAPSTWAEPHSVCTMLDMMAQKIREGDYPPA